MLHPDAKRIRHDHWWPHEYSWNYTKTHEKSWKVAKLSEMYKTIKNRVHPQAKHSVLNPIFDKPCWGPGNATKPRFKCYETSQGFNPKEAWWTRRGRGDTSCWRLRCTCSAASGVVVPGVMGGGACVPGTGWVYRVWVRVQGLIQWYKA